MSLQSRSQRQAQAVYHRITARLHECQTLSATDATQRKGDYERWCQRFPTLVLQNGLLQTLAFIQTKANSEIAGKWFLQDFNTARNASLKSVEQKSNQPVPQAGKSAVTIRAKEITTVVNNNFKLIDDLIEYIRTASVNQYQQETRLALELSLWFKRYAQSVLVSEEDK